MLRARSLSAGRFSRRLHAFTLAEVLAALLFMAIVIPVTMEGVSVASRAGLLGLRKAAAMRIAERVLDETLLNGAVGSSASNGTITEGDTPYPWTMKTQTWSEDAMSEMTVQVTFTVQGNSYEVSASTLYDPAVSNTTTTSSLTP